MVACCLRISKWKLVFYNLCTSLLFIVDLAATIGFLAARSTVIKWLQDHVTNPTEINALDYATKRVDVTGYVLIGTCALTFLVVVFGWLYYCSVRSRSEDLEETLFRSSVN